LVHGANVQNPNPSTGAAAFDLNHSKAQSRIDTSNIHIAAHAVHVEFYLPVVVLPFAFTDFRNAF
jgi:hypothetical protein